MHNLQSGSRCSCATAKYLLSGWLKYQPDTDALLSHIAKDSVSFIPVWASTSSSCQMVPFSVCSDRPGSRVPGGSLVVFADQLLIAEISFAVAPVNLAYALMQILARTLPPDDGNRFDHDFVVIIVLRFKGIRRGAIFQTAGHGEGIDVVGFTTQLRRNKIARQ